MVTGIFYGTLELYLLGLPIDYNCVIDYRRCVIDNRIENNRLLKYETIIEKKKIEKPPKT